MADLKQQLHLYMVTDPDLCRDLGVVETVHQAVRAGVTMVQLRDKHASHHQMVDTALALKQLLAGSGVPLVVNDNVHAAAQADVDGVHIGQGDMSPQQARALIGPGKILGLSCETPDLVRAADPKIVDYLGLGPVFRTHTKADHKPAVGLTGLAEMAALSPLPTVAIGGLKARHHRAVLHAGADGSAVVSAICGQADIAQATQEFFVQEPTS